MFYFFLASCTNVSFVNHQPEFLDPLSEIPEKYHGTFLIKTDTHSIAIDAIDGMSINTDSLVVKSRGNYFYVNILDDNGKQCYLLDNVNENQFNLLVSSVTSEKAELKRIN